MTEDGENNGRLLQSAVDVTEQVNAKDLEQAKDTPIMAIVEAGLVLWTV